MTLPTPPGRLGEIVRRRIADLALDPTPLAALEARALAQPMPRGFRRALAEAGPLAVIAEVKRASPSQGVIAEGVDAPEIARRYIAGGAAALSVLTEPHWFGGALADLIAVRAAVDAPLLRKDFTVERRQIAEARAAGADAVLLMVAVLGREVAPMLAYARDLGLDALVEVHDADELALAADAGADLVGINNRDLRDLSIDLATTENLARSAPTGALLVGESGIETAADAQRMAAAGCQAILVGTALMRGPDPDAAIAVFRRAGFGR